MFSWLKIFLIALESIIESFLFSANVILISFTYNVSMVLNLLLKQMSPNISKVRRLKWKFLQEYFPRYKILVNIIKTVSGNIYTLQTHFFCIYLFYLKTF